MSKIYKHYCTPAISRSDMEVVREDVGQVQVWPEKVRAGEYQTYKITYTVGERPIKIGGVIRFSIPFGFTAPQNSLPIRPGFVSASTKKSGVTLTVSLKKSIWHKKTFTRTKGENNTEHTGVNVYVSVTGASLQKGDQVILTYGDRSYGAEGAAAPYTIGPLQFDVAVDEDGFRKAPFSGFYLCSCVPFVHVLPQKAAQFNIIVPSNAVTGQSVKVIIAALDKYKNLAFDYVGTAELYCEDQRLTMLNFTKEDGGLRHIYVTLQKEGALYLNVLDQESKMEAVSNPIICTKEPSATNYYWGDIHGHTAIQWGQGSGEAYYEYGKEIAGLDFCCLSDPCAGRYTDDDATCRDCLSCYMTDEEWNSIRNINKDFYSPGEFVPILGYEYHNDAAAPQYGGDRNVYYASYDEPIFRCCDEGSYTPEQLWERLEENHIRAITIPHHSAKTVMLNNIELHNEKFQRLIEIYSSWGNSECAGCERPIIGGATYEGHSVQDALNRGMRLGFVAASDTHSGQPGFTYWVFENRSYRGGLTCVMTEQLDREHIFDAMWNRSVYATTGERILLQFTLNGIPMGQEVKQQEGQECCLYVSAIGTDQLEKIEIIKDGQILCCKDCLGQMKAELTFKDISGTRNGTWSYFYARVMQKDKAIAWSSPIWVVWDTAADAD